MYKLFCDSNCELWHTTVKELGLNVIRMPYTVDSDEVYYYDMGEKTDFKGFFDKMKAGAVPKTSALNEQDYIEYFEPVLEKGDDIYYVTFSHKMSGTFGAMKSAIATLKEKYPEREIRYIDSKTISLGSGFVTYYAAVKYNEGATMDELDAYLSELIPHTATYFVVNDLTYLHRGGRVSGLAKVFGNLAGVKPILHFNDEGNIVNIEKARGKKALASLKNYLRTKGSELDKYKIFVLQGDCEQVANDFAASLKEEFGQELDIVVQPIGPVIGAHAGPGTIGLIFHATQR